MSAATQINQLSDPRFEGIIVSQIQFGVTETIKQIGDFTISYKPHFISSSWKTPSKLSVVLDVKHKDETFQVRFHFDPAPIAKILELMLGEVVNPDTSDILDGVGEISNMIYGQIKTKVNSNGYSFNLATPVAFFAKDLPILPPGKTESLIIPFVIGSNECFCEFVVFKK